MALEYVFYVIPPSVNNSRTWLTIDKVVIRENQINNGHRPASGDIFDFGQPQQPAIIGILKDDIVGSSIIQTCFDKRECLGSLTCVSLKDAQLTIKLFLNGSAIPHFEPYVERPIFKSTFIQPATEPAVEKPKNPLRGISHDWRKDYVAQPQTPSRPGQPNDLLSRYSRLPKAMRKRLGAAMKADVAAKSAARAKLG